MTRTSSNTREYCGSRAPIVNEARSREPARRTPGLSIFLPTVIRRVLSSTDSASFRTRLPVRGPQSPLSGPMARTMRVGTFEAWR